MADIEVKPWGWKRMLFNGGGISGAILYIREGHQTSLHSHPKLEVMHVLSGVARVNEKFIAQGETAVIEPFEKHRIAALESVTIFEFGTQHVEAETIRHEVGF